MGYATVLRVPHIRTYEKALKKFELTNPIRGRDKEIRPLGDRRDADTYSIRKVEDNIELVLYKTPVITFKPDGEVELRTGGWHTVSTNQFFKQVLGISSHGQRGFTVLTIDGNKYVLKREVMRIRENGSKWEVLNPEKQYSLTLDRKATAEVRKKYEEFYKYLKGFVNLREESITNRYTGKEKNYVIVPVGEFGSVFEPLKSVEDYAYMNKRGEQYMNWNRVKPEQYTKSANMFEQLIRPDQPEDGKHTNFYKAALLLIAKECVDSMEVRFSEGTVESKKLVPLLDHILFMMNAEKVIKKVELPHGKVPTRAYDHWMVNWE